MKSIWVKLAGCVLPIVLLGTGCTGTRTFTTAARSGETVALAAGWQQSIKRENLTVNITDALGVLTTYAPSDPRVRNIVNLYPDPLSGAIVGQAIGNTSYNQNATATDINYMTGYDPDWWQTTVFLDLPTAMNIGQARIDLINGVKTIRPIYVEILPGTSVANPFGVYSQPTVGTGTTTAQDVQLQSMGRVANYVVKFTGGTTYPDSIQLQFTHDPDSTITGGVGKTFVVNPRGEKKNLSWTDDGTNLRVMLTSTGDGTNKYGSLTTYKWSLFKFYVSGGITGLSQPVVKAYDINGNLMAGVTATATAQ